MTHSGNTAMICLFDTLVLGLTRVAMLQVHAQYPPTWKGTYGPSTICLAPRIRKSRFPKPLHQEVDRWAMVSPFF